MNANGYICLLDEYFDIEFDNENEYYTISKDCMERLYKKIAQKEFEAKFFNKQYNKCVDLLKDKNNIYRKRAHTYKVEMERCRRKLTRMYRMLYDMYYCDYGDKEDAEQLVKEWKDV